MHNVKQFKVIVKQQDLVVYPKHQWLHAQPTQLLKMMDLIVQIILEVMENAHIQDLIKNAQKDFVAMRQLQTPQIKLVLHIRVDV